MKYALLLMFAAVVSGCQRDDWMAGKVVEVRTNRFTTCWGVAVAKRQEEMCVGLLVELPAGRRVVVTTYGWASHWILYRPGDGVDVRADEAQVCGYTLRSGIR